jgi:hypothetical protein
MGSNKINHTRALQERKVVLGERRIDAVLLPPAAQPYQPHQLQDSLALIADQSVLPGERSALQFQEPLYLRPQQLWVTLRQPDSRRRILFSNKIAGISPAS